MPTDVDVTLALVVFGALLLTACVYDVLWRRIPNWVVALLIVAYAGLAGAHQLPFDAAMNLGGFAVAFVGAFVLWKLKVIGGGDAKMFAATALFAGLQNLWLLFAATAIAGGVVALVVIALRARSRIAGQGLGGLVADGVSAAAVASERPDLPVRTLLKQARENPTKGVPYGVAIAVGALVTAQMTGYLELHHGHGVRHVDARDLSDLVRKPK
jgi:prepilin peptidase CpaA